MVIMALVTTMTTAPALRWLVPESALQKNTEWTGPATGAY